MSKQKFTIVVPAYNEEQGIGKVLGELQAKFGERAHIIVVNDGSTDKTATVVSRFKAVTLVNHKLNYGYGASLKTGLVTARTDIICFIDADAQHDVKDVEKLVDALDTDVDMVIGSRGFFAFNSLLRAPGKLLLNLVARVLIRRKITDFNSGLRAVRRKIILPYLHLLPDGFSATTNMTLLLLADNYYVTSLPIRIKKRIGKSSVKIIRDGLNTLSSIFRIIVFYNPLRVFLPLGLLFFLLGLGYGIYIVCNGPAGLSTGAFLLIFMGIISLMFGFLADQIAVIRRERTGNAATIYESRIKK